MDLVKVEFDKRKMYKKIFIPLFICTIVLSSAISACENLNLNFFLQMFLQLCLLVALFQNKIAKKIIYVVLFTLIAVLSEMILSLTYGAYSGVSIQELANNNYSWTMITLCSEIVKLILVKIWERCFGRNRHEAGGKIFGLSLLFPIVTVVLTYEMVELSAESDLSEYRRVMALIILMFIANAVLFYYVEQMMVMMNQQKEYALMKQKTEMESQYYKRMEQVNREQALYRHDMKHYLEAIAGLAEENDVEKLKKVTCELYEGLNKVERIHYTGNEIFNVILWEKTNHALEQNIQMELQIEPAVDTSFIKDTDLIAMVGNMIDNAIEATHECEADQKISISLFETEGNFIIFQVINPFKERPVIKKGRLITSKKDAKNHGMGVESIRKIAEKYGGILDIDIDKGIFKATLGIALI
ncbi:MAG: ATP-binding protein [Clostridia bacterium]|nr:ATP-binding protein [Clostridia bacterium]